MGKRTFASVLWFLAVGSAWNYLAMVSDLPSSIGLALGAAVAVLVWVDPLRRIWSTAQDAPAHESVASTVAPGARQART
jgi:hypothetical protein